MILSISCGFFPLGLETFFYCYQYTLYLTQRCSSQAKSINSFANLLSLYKLCFSPKFIYVYMNFSKCLHTGSYLAFLRSVSQVSRKCLRCTNRLVHSYNSLISLHESCSSDAILITVLSTRTSRGSEYTFEFEHAQMYALQWRSNCLFKFH